MIPIAMSEATCWTMISGAASGSDADRREFADRYLPVVRAYLRARWQGRLDPQEHEDAVQEVFVECLRRGGALERVQRDRGEGFRAFLYGVARNVARRSEERRARRLDQPGTVTFYGEGVQGEDASLSRVFDRAWAQARLREALERMQSSARDDGDECARGLELLRARFRDGRSVHELAAEWGVDRGRLHHELRRALRDFEAALKAVVAFHHPDSPEVVAEKCHELLALAR